MKQPTLDEVRSFGFKVMVTHKRPQKGVVFEKDVDPATDERWMTENERKTRGVVSDMLSPVGGWTRVTILNDEEREVGEAVAWCRRPNPERNDPGDTFNKHLGLTIALGRALKAANLKIAEVEGERKIVLRMAYDVSASMPETV